MCDFCVFEKIALPHLNVWSYGVIVAAAHSFFLPLSVDLCRTFKEVCSIWKSLGLLPHGNILQADLGVAHQRQTTERNLEILWWEVALSVVCQNISGSRCNQSSLWVCRRHNEGATNDNCDTIKDPRTQRCRLSACWGDDQMMEVSCVSQLTLTPHSEPCASPLPRSWATNHTQPHTPIAQLSPGSHPA